MSQIAQLFPTPVMRVEKLLHEDLIRRLTSEFAASRKLDNDKSNQLSHSEIMSPSGRESFLEVSKLIRPKLVEFGALLFGEDLEWTIKEIWINILETGGKQAIHTHANSFVSGVLYLTNSHRSANLVFHKSLGGTDFIFSNQNKNVKYGPFNGSKWAMPVISAGDLVLFPSYLLHEVPVNHGDRRISVAFNAVPKRLDSFGYAVNFS
ncbi:TIGR02466 family protein [Hyphomicrobium facile]|uniref:2OG-Fe(II) oxygenase superfamily protein n=1 Tax=Hyphomicrobium facile TaxID=51670 RepID=A0A1I7N4I3_9HYPH|nr:TIGR02466 family protein [Hyphomicrobium facile]SFV29567.1 conserved hypothetical protein [Hyphomicrobium facile]